MRKPSSVFDDGKNPYGPPPWWVLLRYNIRNEFFYRVRVLSLGASFKQRLPRRWAFWDLPFEKRILNDTHFVTAKTDAY